MSRLKQLMHEIHRRSLWQVLAISQRDTDGWQTFVNHRIDQEPFESSPDVFFGDYINISAHGGLVVPTYVHFIGETQLAVSVALFRFKPGTQQTPD